MNKKVTFLQLNIILQNLVTFGHIHLHMFKFLHEHILFANMGELVAFIHEVVTYVICFITYGCPHVI